MVYCTKCGAKNEDSALVCVKCGASLEAEKYPARRYARRRWEDECFGLPHGGAIVGLVIGAIILIAGLFWAISEVFGIPTPNVGSVAMVLFGILIVVAALYAYSRR